jgi:hypothetical protein
MERRRRDHAADAVDPHCIAERLRISVVKHACHDFDVPHVLAQGNAVT